MKGKLNTGPTQMARQRRAQSSSEALIGFITCRGTKIPHRPTVNQGALPRAVHRS